MNSFNSAISFANPALAQSNRPTALRADTKDSADTLNNTLERIKQLIAHLDQRFQEIGSITVVIAGLSKRSNLLALNAAIEAARAGEVGRGFSIVADEMRKLSENSASAAADISKKLDSVLQESKESVSKVESAERESAMHAASLIAARDAARLEQRFLRIAVAEAGIKHFISGCKQAGITPRREDIDALMAESLRANPDLLAFSCGCEPNELDGRDADYVNKGAGHDKTGRYVPYWHRGNGTLTQEALANYDIPGENDYYEIPRKTQRDTLMEPYLYPVGGQEVLMTSLMQPILVQGKFIGVIGADYALSQLHDELERDKPFGHGERLILSNLATYVTHPDASQQGKPALDLPEEAIAAIHAGKSYHFIDKDQIAFVFHPLNIGGDTPWSMLIKFDLLKTISQ